MFKLFHKKLNKKGFTLAELLIVVAIISVLVAIAIPIFMNSLAKAERAASDANVRSVKAAAINQILNHWDTEEYLGYKDGSKRTKPAEVWVATGKIENGNITNCTVKVSTLTPDQARAKVPKVTKTDSTDSYTYEIEDLYIVDTEVNKT